MPPKMLITGATGFVGRGLVAHLMAKSNFSLRLALRNKAAWVAAPCDFVEVGDINGDTQWDRALDDVDVVLHLAARVHVMQDYAKNPLEAFRETNLYGTQKLACAASQRGVKRFIYVSSIGVNGSHTDGNKPFSETDKPHPHNAYAISKWEAEQALQAVALTSGMEFVIVRPPLVYGRDAPGNFAQLMRVVGAGVPLPFAAVENLRSFVALDNLTDFIRVCAIHPNAANQIFLVSDGRDVSTPAFIAAIANGLHRRAFLFPLPLWILAACAALMGQRVAFQRLCGSLQVDTSKASNLLGWIPPVSVDDGLRSATLQRKK
jgi:nucleoside-diphosphate-sugar epimerase